MSAPVITLQPPYRILRTVTGSDTDRWLAFRQAFRQLENRIRIFVSLQHESLDRLALQARLQEIGRLRVDEV